MDLLGKNLLINAVYYAITVVALPGAILFVDNTRYPSPALRVIGAIAIVAGAALQMWCIVLFHRRGHGTPTPALPPRTLVTSGPYRVIRSPMNAGEVLLFIGMAAWFGSLGLALYAAASWIAFHIFIIRYEEPHLARTFGAEYEDYRRRTGRWLP